jgi:hypothetical protein
VNLGNDADTTAAIYRQLASAFYGAQQIPPEWKSKLIMHDSSLKRLVSISGTVSSNNNHSRSLHYPALSDQPAYRAAMHPEYFGSLASISQS